MGNCSNYYNSHSADGGCRCASPCGGRDGISGFDPRPCSCGGIGQAPSPAPAASRPSAYGQYTGALPAAGTGDVALSAVVENGCGYISSVGSGVVLAPGAYEIAYGFSASVNAAGGFTVTPYIDSIPQQQYASVYSAAYPSSNTIGRSFIVSGAVSRLVTFGVSAVGGVQPTNASFSASVKKID